MLKNLVNMFKKIGSSQNSRLLNTLYPVQKYFFVRGSKKSEMLSLNKQFLSSHKLEDYNDINGEKIANIKKFSGTFHYLPLDDHPLIPGYSRLISITKEIAEKLIEEKVEEKRLCMSVLKNPDKLEGVSLPL